ncbi:MAG: hypothetical protein UW15_C0009G0001, partial [Parcubacteria group bacterium GW2011_GWC1_44_10]
MSEDNKSSVDSLDDTLYSRTRYHDPLGKRPAMR